MRYNLQQSKWTFPVKSNNDYLVLVLKCNFIALRNSNKNTMLNCWVVVNFAREMFALSWCWALFCLTFLVHTLCGSCTGGMCHFSWYKCCYCWNIYMFCMLYVARGVFIFRIIDVSKWNMLQFTSIMISQWCYLWNITIL